MLYTFSIYINSIYFSKGFNLGIYNRLLLNIL